MTDRQTYQQIGAEPLAPTMADSLEYATTGITQRAWIATHLLAGLMAHHGINDLDFDEAAKFADEQALALLKRFV